MIGADGESDTDSSGRCLWRMESKDGVDSCQRESTSDGFCVVHSPNVNLEAEDFCQYVEGDESLVGLFATELDLSKKVIDLDDNEPIDLSGARIQKLIFDDAEITNEVKFNDAVIKQFSANRAIFERGLCLRNTNCDEFIADGAEFRSHLKLEDTEFTECLKIERGKIERLKGNTGTNIGEFRLSYSVISEELLLDGATFENDAHLAQTRLGGRCSLKGGQFGENLNFSKAKIRGRFSMRNATVEETASFQKTNFVAGQADFADGYFGSLNFKSAIADDRILFATDRDEEKTDPAIIKTEATFSGADVKELNLEGVRVGGELKLDRLSATRLRASRLSCGGLLNLSDSRFGGEVNLEKATVDQLNLQRSNFRGPANFSGATVDGPVRGEEATYYADVDWCDGKIEGRARFDKSSFKASTTFAKRTFNNPVYFHGVRFEGVVVFSYTIFEGGVRFDRRTLEDKITPPAKIESDASFVNAKFEGIVLSETYFGGAAQFDEATFNQIDDRLLYDQNAKRQNQNIDIREELENRDDQTSLREDVYVPSSDQIERGVEGGGDTNKSHREDSDRIDEPECAYFSDIDFEGRLSLKEISSEGRLDLRRARVKGDVNLDGKVCGLTLRRARIRGAVDSTGLDVDGKLDSSKVTYHSDTNWGGGKVTSVAIFDRCRFGADVSFKERAFESSAYFRAVRFRGSTDFSNTEFHNHLNNSHSDKGTNQNESTIEENSTSSSDRPVVVNFEKATFDDSASFEHVIIGGSLNFAKASFEEVYIEPKTDRVNTGEMIETPPTLGLYGSRIRAGKVWVCTDEGSRIQLDLTKARLGDVTFHPRDQVEHIFDHCKVDRTEFDGFNFTPYATELRARRWTIHEAGKNPPRMNFLKRKWHALKEAISDYTHIFRGEDSETDYQRLRTTYQYAKQGASHSGQNEAASRLFQREMEYQSRQLACEFKERPKGVFALIKFTAIWGFGVTSRYGESGIRVVATALFIVAVYTFIYRLLPDVGDNVFESFTLSVGAFSTLLIGGTGESVSLFTMFAAASQGFFGALMAALLLFTLTRSIHR